ncbi:thiamine pyrophosphate-binding protein [Amycolatopsis rhabdoformis]|uniref:Thiamine pyrophosphate-binding protein n=1 Tax=Amycolatopsis rhabdoformis TaxID=1448059 RepID=A0ABZ1IEM5_9PSEU|nr:thiamine pyrophosphate-binding protein [Amycolatopsis rhabdoformis]WSE31900.1 thiamine pyrophosphate-binding protein [Amycolatopsis rhabdoformis]
MTVRTAAQVFVDQLAACGVTKIFGNPGTTEYAVLDAVRERDDVEFVLCLHEGVAVSAAAGYARASGQVGVVELHAGPGLGNGLGMIYDAWAGQTPLVVYVGQGDQSTLYLEPTLGADLVGMATPVTKWAYEIRTPDEVAQVVRRAMKVAHTPPYGPVVLSLPMDVSEQPSAGAVTAPSALRHRLRPDADALAEAAELLLAADAPLIVPGDGVARSGALAEVGRLARLVGAPIRGGTMSETAIEPGEPLTADRLHFGGEEARAVLARYDVVVAVGTKVFTQLFPLPGDPAPGCRIIHIGLDAWELGKSHPSTLVAGDERQCLAELADLVELKLDETRAARAADRRRSLETSLAQAASQALAADRQRWDESPMTPARACFEITRAMPEDACVVDEAITTQGVFYRYFTPQPGRWFRARGGGIGEGLPMALGVQAARPGTPVVALTGDGSSMYSLTAYWTAAHHELPVVWVVLNNATYRILQDNAVRRRPAAQAQDPVLATSLQGPEIDHAAVARGLGCAGVRVTEPAELGSAIHDALASGRPTVIDLVLAPR